MAKEIERKYLVAKDGWKKLDLLKKHNIEQGYIHDDGNLAVRIRITDEDAWLTIKCDGKGISRSEYEYQIPLKDGQALIKKAPKTLKKTRSYVRDEKNQLWEIDQFKGLNRGLTLAEIELPSARTHVEIPEWLGREVSEDPNYLNTNLINSKVKTK